MRNPIAPARLSALIVLCAANAAPARAQQAPAGEPPAASPSAAPAAPAAAPADDGDAPRIDFTQALREGQNPMTADQAAAQTVKTAPSVRRAQAQERRSREAASEALVIAWPRVDLEARYTRLGERGDFLTGGYGDAFTGLFRIVNELAERNGIEPIPTSDVAAPELPADHITFQARLAVPLSDIFLTILPRYRAAEHAAEAQALNARAEAATVALLAREAFYNYARARAALLVVQSSLEQSEAQRRDINALVSAGTLARVESMRADAQVAAAKVSLSRAQGAVAVARVAFRTLLHMPGNDEVALVDDWSEPLPPLRETQEQLYQTALRQRAELQALRTLTEAQDETLSATSAEQWPRLGIGGAAELSRPNQAINPYSTEFEPSWQVFAALTWSPNDVATASSRYGQTEADRESTLADMAVMEDALRREVAQGFEDYLAASNSMESALTGIRAAEESYRVRREQFRAGAAVAIDVIDAEAELRRARLELINAAIDVRIARARLDRAVGRDQ